MPETSEAGPAPRRVEVGAPAWVGPGRCVALVLLADCRGGIVGGCWDDGGLGGGDLEGGGCNASCGCNLVDRSIVGLDDLAVLAATSAILGDGARASCPIDDGSGPVGGGGGGILASAPIGNGSGLIGGGGGGILDAYF